MRPGPGARAGPHRASEKPLVKKAAGTWRMAATRPSPAACATWPARGAAHARLTRPGLAPVAARPSCSCEQSALHRPRLPRPAARRRGGCARARRGIALSMQGGPCSAPERQTPSAQALIGSEEEALREPLPPGRPAAPGIRERGAPAVRSEDAARKASLARRTPS